MYYILFAVVIGTIYFYVMEWNIPKESNCSYISNIWTDIFAFIYGFIIVYYGYLYDNIILKILGVSIITEHILQFYRHKLN